MRQANSYLDFETERDGERDAEWRGERERSLDLPRDFQLWSSLTRMYAFSKGFLNSVSSKSRIAFFISSFVEKSTIPYAPSRSAKTCNTEDASNFMATKLHKTNATQNIQWCHCAQERPASSRHMTECHLEPYEIQSLPICASTCLSLLKHHPTILPPL